MAKTIAEKIDFLMTLTGTRNSELGRALHFDASYISRIRSGKRGLPKGQPFLEPAGIFFARAIREDYQKEAAEKAMELTSPWPMEEKEAARILRSWLFDKTPASKQQTPIGNALDALMQSFAAESGSRSRYIPDEGISAPMQLFFGNKGKRDAVITFLEELAKTQKAHTLLLFSDEDMVWLYEDVTFLRTWMTLMQQLIRTGSRIRIIHSIGRSAGDMWEAVRNWMPLYATGAVEPWYCPRLRDGIFKRTEFIAQGHSAVFGSSVPGQTGNLINALIRSPEAADTMQREFEAFLALCKPLMEVFRPTGEEELKKLQDAIINTSGELLSAKQNGMNIQLKKGVAALVVKEEPPYAAFIIKEPRMLAALEQYLQNLQ